MPARTESKRERALGRRPIATNIIPFAGILAPSNSSASRPTSPMQGWDNGKLCQSSVAVFNFPFVVRVAGSGTRLGGLRAGADHD